MLNRSLPRLCLNIFLAIAVVAGSMFAVSTSLSAAPTVRPAAKFADLGDTGKFVALRVGEQLVVKLPMHEFNDSTWHVAKISPSLRLIAGPDELRPIEWSPWTLSYQIFYF